MRYLFLLALVGVANAADDVTGKIERRYGGGYWLATGFNVPQEQLDASQKFEAEKKAKEEAAKADEKKSIEQATSKDGDSKKGDVSDTAKDLAPAVPRNFPSPPVHLFIKRKK